MTLPRWIARWWAPPESICEQRLRAWFPEAYEDRKAGRVPPATSAASVVRAVAPTAFALAHPDPTAQYAIEIRALLDAAYMAPQTDKLVRPHQLDRDGQEIRH